MARFFLVPLALVLCVAPLWADDPGVKTTVAYVQKLQAKSGGFLTQAPPSKPQTVPTLRATSSAVRTVHYLKAAVLDEEACVSFVASCHAGQSGGYVETPSW